MTITAQNARARHAPQPRGLSKQNNVFDIASFIYWTKNMRKEWLVVSF